jgi:inhibitor of KinA sporulation pathway (predicted exonuclease)
MATGKKYLDRIERILKGWETLAPGKSFGGMTLQQFKTAMEPFFRVRDEIRTLEEQRNAKLAERDSIDTESMKKAQLVVNGVLADPTEGPDSALYESFGYVRKSERQSGLTRKQNKNGKGGKE